MPILQRRICCQKLEAHCIFTVNLVYFRMSGVQQVSESQTNTVTTPESEPLSVRKSPGSQGAARPRRLLRRVDLALLPILALPLLILRADDTWLFAYSATPGPPGCMGCEHGYIDPWVYFGYFLDLTHHLLTFRTGYFGGRLPWIVPGYLAYHFFPPLVAPYVLHLAFYWVALVSLYLILKHTVSQRAALLTALLMGCHSYFLWAIGWDYVNGAAITYILLTLCALTYTARSERPRRWLMLSGVIFGAAIYCQLFLINFSPLFALYYYFARKEYGRGPFRSAFRPFAHGFLALTFLFCVFNVVFKAAPLFFIIPSLSRAARYVGAGDRWYDPSYKWITSAIWLLFPAVVLIGALLFVSRRDARTRGGFPFFWQIYFVLSTVIMLLWQLQGQPIFQVAYYASYLIPPTFLALGAQTADVLQRFSRRQFAALCCGAAVILFLPFVLPLHSGLIFAIQQHRSLWPALLGTVAVILLIRKARYTGALAVLLLCAACASLTATTGTRTWGHPGEPDDPAVRKQAFLAVVDSVRAVQEIDPTDHLFFWYDEEARLGPLHRSVASTFMWSHRLVSERFPLLGDQAATWDLKPKVPPPHTRVAILTVDDQALQRAESSLRQVGLTARFLGQRRISEGPISWNMILIETEKAN